MIGSCFRLRTRYTRLSQVWTHSGECIVFVQVFSLCVCMAGVDAFERAQVQETMLDHHLSTLASSTDEDRTKARACGAKALEIAQASLGDHSEFTGRVRAKLEKVDK